MVEDNTLREGKKVSVIIPALNEEENIYHSVMNVIETFDKLDISGEIIVINDGSTDRTGIIVREIIDRYPFVRMITHDKSYGIGVAYWKGVNASCGEVVTWTSGDGELDIFEILQYLPLMNSVDVVVPFIYNDRKRRSWKRLMVSRIFRWIVNLSFGFSLNHTNGCVIYRRSILQEITLKSMGFFFQTELLSKCLKKGYLYAEVPIANRLRVGGKSKSLTLKSLINVICDYVYNVFDFYLFVRNEATVAPDSKTALRWQRLREK